MCITETAIGKTVIFFWA